MAELIFTLRQVSALRKMRVDLPPVLTEVAINFFKDSFKKGGFTDRSFKEWQPRKDERSRFNAAGEKIRFKKTDMEARGVLIKSGKLRRSISPHPDRSIIGVQSALPYSVVHNEGGRAGRGKGFIMAQRQYVGESEKLLEDIERRILDDLDKAFTG